MIQLGALRIFVETNQSRLIPDQNLEFDAIIQRKRRYLIFERIRRGGTGKTFLIQLYLADIIWLANSSCLVILKSFI